MPSPETRRLVRLIRRAFEGPAWYGPAIQEVLEDFDPEDADLRVGGSQSPLELLLHMVQWRQYAIRLLKGDHALVSREEMTYPRVENGGEYGWTDARVRLDNSQAELVRLVERFPAERLDEEVPERDFTWATLLHGLVNHDVYHLGQLRFLQKWAPKA